MVFLFLFSFPALVSSFIPHTAPDFPIRAMNGQRWSLSVAMICPCPALRLAAQISDFVLLSERKKTRPQFEPIARMLIGSLRILVSGVITIQRLWPHSASQMASSSFCGKYWSCTLQLKPSLTSRLANFPFPNFGQGKKWGIQAAVAYLMTSSICSGVKP